MLHSYNDLRHYPIRAADERKGNVEDFYFDDVEWKIRYLVAHTGFLWTGRDSLIGVDLLSRPDTNAMEFPVAMSAEEVEEAGRAGDHALFGERDRGSEKSDLMPLFWPSLLIGAPEARYTPILAQEQLSKRWNTDRETSSGDAEVPDHPRLRSMSEVSGYQIAAQDGEIGSVDDFLIDPEDWSVRYFVIDTGSWLPGKLVVVRTDQVEAIRTEDRVIAVRTDMTDIENAPRLGDIEELKKSSAQEMYERYGAIGYWPSGI